MSSNGTRRRMKGDGETVAVEEINSEQNKENGESWSKESIPSKEKESTADTQPYQTEAGNENAGIWDKLQPKWKNWWIRGFGSLVMLGGFAVVVYFGPVALILLIQCIQIKCYHEIISIGHKKYQKHNLPWFRSLSWYFLGCSNYFFYGESISEYFNGVPQKEEVVKTFLTYHRFISFLLYCIGLVLFVLSLKKDYYKVQFSLFGWTHVTLLIVVTQSHLIMQTLFEGLIWFFLPVSMVICNDIMAYIFGFFFGRTPLIKLSPKKTWEGFIGGGVATVIYGWLISYVMCQYQYFVCPVEFVSVTHDFRQECEPSPLFHLTSYSVPSVVQYIFGLVGVTETPVWIYPMQFHSLSLALFSSLIAPFGGFLASGFKRAFKVKDFGDTIPGHGGIMDRFDCQYLMATFVHVYIFTFIRAPQLQKIFQMILALKPESQVKIYEKLKASLMERELIN